MEGRGRCSHLLRRRKVVGFAHTHTRNFLKKVSCGSSKTFLKESFMKTIMYSTEPCFRAGLRFLYLSATDPIVLPKAFRGHHPKCSTGKTVGFAHTHTRNFLKKVSYGSSKTFLRRKFYEVGHSSNRALLPCEALFFVSFSNRPHRTADSI